MVLPARKKNFQPHLPEHQHQEAYTIHKTKLSQWGQTTKAKRAMNLQPVKRGPQTQEVKQNEKTEKHTADEGARGRPTRPNK